MKQHTIILAEDNLIEAKFIKYLLYDKDNVVLIHCQTGKEAYDAIKTIIPDLVLLDINMPIMNGIEVIEGIRELGIICPIVVLSTSNEPKDINASYISGANSYLIKPIDFNKFKIIFEKTIDYWININQPCYH